MPSPLLPTVGIQSDGGSRKQTTDMRLRAFTPNQNIAFSVKPSDNLKYAKEAADTISKYAQAIQAEKERALVNEAIGMYQEDLASIETDYYNKKLDNAVNGFDDYQKSIKALEQKYGKVFNRGNMQSALNDKMSDYAIQARVNGRNHHDKEVQAKAGAELEARLDQSVDYFFTHIGSPFDKQNRAEVQGNMTALLSHKGITDPNSALYTETKQAYFDKAYYRPINAMISKDPRRALMYLEGVKDDISPMRYEELKYNAHYRMEMNAEMQARREARNAQREYNRALRDKTKALKVDQKTYEAYYAEELAKGLADNDALPEEKRLPEKHIEMVAQELATAKYVESKKQEDFITNQDVRYVTLINNAYAMAIENNQKQQFLDNPFSFFNSEEIVAEIKRLYGNNDIKKAEKWVRQNLLDSNLSKENELVNSFYAMTDEEKVETYGTPEKLGQYQMSAGSYQVIMDGVEKAKTNIENGKSSPLKTTVVDAVMPYFKLTPKDKSDPDKGADFILVRAIGSKVLTKLQNEARKDGIPLTELSAFTATQEYLESSEGQKLLKGSQENENIVMRVWNANKESLRVNRTNDRETQQIVRTLSLKFFDANKRFVKDETELFNLLVARDHEIVNMCRENKEDEEVTKRLRLFGDPKDVDTSISNTFDLKYYTEKDLKNPNNDPTGLGSIHFWLERDRLQRQQERIEAERLRQAEEEQKARENKGE